MRLSTGMRGICKQCNGEIYFSSARDADDPWVHADWTKHVVPGEPEWVGVGKLPAYDHPASPTLVEHVFSIAVSTPVTDVNIAKNHVRAALDAAGLVVSVTRGLV